MKEISFLEITQRLETFDLPQADHVIGITTGGVVLAALLAYKLSADFSLMRINYRDENNVPCFDEPHLLQDFSVPKPVSKIIIADDVSVSGKTMKKARDILKDYDVSTFVLSGKADFVLFPEIKSCVKWPWSSQNEFKGSLA